MQLGCEEAERTEDHLSVDRAQEIVVVVDSARAENRGQSLARMTHLDDCDLTPVVAGSEGLKMPSKDAVAVNHD